MLWILIPIVILFMIAGGWLHHKHEQQRREALAALAGRLGWRFSSPRDDALTHRLREFTGFNQGHSHSAHNTLRGEIGMHGRPTPVTTGDYLYKVTRNSGKNRSTTTYRLSYLLAELPFATTPPLSVRREGFFDKLGAAVGFDDIDFESKQFSDRFHVKSKHQRFAYDVIDPLMIEFLMGAQQPGGEPPTFHLDRGWLLVLRKQSRWTPEEFHTNIAWTREFLDRWPQHVVDRLATQPGY